MEAIIWIAAAIIVYFIGTGKKREQEKNRKEKIYLGGSLFAALCCELAIKVVIPYPLPVDMANSDVCADRGAVQPNVVDLHLHTGETEPGLFHVDQDGGRHGDPGVLLCESFP